MKHIVVIGAGIAGLSCAFQLQQKGYKVTVFEKESYAGGRMTSRKKDGLTFDPGTDFLVDNYRLLKSYAERFGIRWITTRPGGEQRVLKDGKPYDLDLPGPLALLKFKMLPLIDRIKFLKFIIQLKFGYHDLNFYDLSELPSELDSTNARDYLEKHVSKAVADYIADPFTAAMQFHGADQASTAAMLALLKMMIDPNSGFRVRYTEGGLCRIPFALAKELDITYDTPVDEVAYDPEGVIIKVKGREQRYDAAVLAATANATLNMLKKPTQQQLKVLSATEYAATIVIAFKVPDNIFAHAHCTYVPFVENQNISGYSNEGRKGKDVLAGGKSLLNVYLHESCARKLMDRSDDDVYAFAEQEIRKVCPETAGVSLEPHDLQRWPYAMPRFDHGFITTIKQFWPYQGEHKIFLCGDYLNSPWTEGAARCGKKVAELMERQLQ